MTDQQHPIIPTPELRCQWQSESPFKIVSVEREDYMIDRAAQWAADMELEACCGALDDSDRRFAANYLRYRRRPKPPSATAQAEALIERFEDGWCPSPAQWHTIREGLTEGRRALEKLQQLEDQQ